MKFPQLILSVVLASGVGIPAFGSDTPPPPSKRTFVLTYEAGVRGLKRGEQIQLWLPIWVVSPYQRLHKLEVRADGADVFVEPKYGNRVLLVRTVASGATEQTIATVRLTVTRQEVRAPITPLGEYAPSLRRYANVAPTPLSPKERALFLGPNARVPVGGPAVRLLAGQKLAADRLRLARQLYDTVLSHMTYRKEGKGWGQGDVAWACQAGYGNCTDFHSLFISLARYYGIPARFVIGFPLPAERGTGTIGGYHCWAYFYVERIGWIPVDISEADKHPALASYYFGNLTENRIALSMGRDLVLDPTQAGEPLNYFIYPVARIGGKPAGKDQVWWRVSYRDLEVEN